MPSAGAFYTRGMTFHGGPVTQAVPESLPLSAANRNLQMQHLINEFATASKTTTPNSNLSQN